MTVNTAVFSLLEEVLFSKMPESNMFPSDRIFWNSVYIELESQAVLGLVSVAVPNHNEIPFELKKVWNDYQRMSVVKYVQMYAAQTEATDLIRKAGIEVAVMKGMASACYYPIPEHRTMGDVDLLVKPKDYHRSIEILKKNQFIVEGEEEARYHTAFEKYGIIFELHQSPASVHKDVHGEKIREYILSGLDSIEINRLGPDQFPILPWKQNGMELIWHIRQHLYNGLGLRHIIDWMMFVNYILDDEHYKEYGKDLEQCGLDQLAIHVTRLCQKYLGLREEGISWCKEADEKVCDELMKFIMEQGNFGIKKGMDDKTAKVLSGYNRPSKLLGRLQEIGKAEWKLLKKFPILEPVAWIYAAIVEVKIITKQKGWLKNLLYNIQSGNRREKMYRKLYENEKRHN